MARKQSELEVRCFVLIPGREPVPVEELTRDEYEYWQCAMRERLGKVMNDYYRQNPEEYRKFCEQQDAEVPREQQDAELERVKWEMAEARKKFPALRGEGKPGEIDPNWTGGRLDFVPENRHKHKMWNAE